MLRALLLLAMVSSAEGAQTSFVDVIGNILGMRTDGAGNLFVLTNIALTKNPCKGPGLFCNGYEYFGPVSAGAFDVSGDGSAYLAGSSFAPGTPGAYKVSNPSTFFASAAIAKVDPQGHTVYLTYLCAASDCSVSSVAAAPDGSLWITGTTKGDLYGLPQSFPRPYIARLDAKFENLHVLPNTMGLGGFLIAVASEGAIYIAMPGGNMVSALSTAGDLLFNTVIPNAVINAISIGPNGSLMVTGTTQGGMNTTPGVVQPSYPPQPTPTPLVIADTPPICAPNLLMGGRSCFGGGPFADNIFPPTGSGFVASVDATGTISFLTYLGGSGYTLLSDVRFDVAANAFAVAGYTNAQDFPGLSGGARNCVPSQLVSLLSPDGTRVDSTYLVLPPVGGTAAWSVLSPSGSGPSSIEAAGPDGTLYVSFGTTVAIVDPSLPDSSVACLFSSADRQFSLINVSEGENLSAAVSPGSLVTIYGNNLSSVTETLQPAGGLYPLSASGLSVTFDSLRAPLLFISPEQINFQVPYELAGHGVAEMSLSGFAFGAATFEVPVLDSPIATVFSVPFAPGECGSSYAGELKPMVLNQDSTLNSCENPAQPGSTVTAFFDVTGDQIPFGQTGGITTAAFTLPYPFDVLGSGVIVRLNAVVGAISGVYSLTIQIPNTALDVAGSLSIPQGAISIRLSGDQVFYVRVAGAPVIMSGQSN